MIQLVITFHDVRAPSATDSEIDFPEHGGTHSSVCVYVCRCNASRVKGVSKRSRQRRAWKSERERLRILEKRTFCKLLQNSALICE